MGLVDREHLPECPQAKRYGMPCICPELHACELRMMQRKYLLDEGDPFREVYRAGLRDAVEAVKTALTDDDGYVRQSELDDAVAAIEALDAPPPLPPTTGRQHKY